MTEESPKPASGSTTNVTPWTNNFFQRTGSFDQSGGAASGGGAMGNDKPDQTPGGEGGEMDVFRGRSSSWSTWSREILWPRRHQRQRGISESSDTSSTLSGTGNEVTIHSRTKSTSVLPSPLVRHSSSGGGGHNHHHHGRQRHHTEEAVSTAAGNAVVVASKALPPPGSPADSAPPGQENLSFGTSDQMVYDIDGKFPYSVYESKPTFYDVDGIHRYKHFKAFKPTPYTSGAPHHESRPVCYDLDGKVTCFTVRDIANQRLTARGRTPVAGGIASSFARAQSVEK